VNRLGRRTGKALLAAGVLALLMAAPARAATPAATGVASSYWWQPETATTAVPAPPTVPAGGLWVSSDPAGPQAVSAVRFTLVDGATDPVLTLSVDPPQAVGQAGALVVACPTTDNWKSGPGPSPWAGRPTSDCKLGSVTGVLSSNGRTMSFALSKLASGPDVDVVLQPAPAAPGSTVNASFDPATAANVKAQLPAPAPTPPPASTPPDTTPLAPPLPSSASPSPAVTAPPVVASSGGLGGVAAAAQAPSLAGTPSGSTGASAGPGAGAGTGTGAASFSPTTGNLAGSVGRTRSWRDRLLLAIAIFDIALYLVWSRHRAPTPERAAAGAAGGRVGKPPPLR
jgi:hypothetical protein